MTVLSSKKILQEKNTSDANSITSLNLTQKALSDVSCLSEFKNLEKLDLGFNNLTSLEGLASCVNLKWLSVVQNKLQSLKGIENLTKLTVLNAGKNKLKSTDEVKSIVTLRALILNDNEITSVCKLDHMKELNTLVLSRNPISSLGESLIKSKSITKLSLANCQLQTIDSSLKSCTELKELRLAHNEIMSLSSDFARLVKLQNLDLGNNLIAKWFNLKVLSSLSNLKNLNLQGNPVAEKDKLSNKVQKILPNLHSFNSRPIDKITKREVDNKINDTSVATGHNSTLHDDMKIDQTLRKKNSRKAHSESENNKDNPFESSEDLGSKNKKNKTLDEKSAHDVDTSIPEKKSKHKKQKTDKKSDGKSRKEIDSDNVNVFDDSETPFMDLFTSGAPEILIKNDVYDNKFDNRYVDANSGLVTFPAKKKKKNRALDPSALELSQVDEIGLGGPSAWV